MTMITPSYLGETIEYSSLHACRSTLEDPTVIPRPNDVLNGLCARFVSDTLNKLRPPPPTTTQLASLAL